MKRLAITLPLAITPALAVISCNGATNTTQEKNEKIYKVIISRAISPVECLKATMFKKEIWGEWVEISYFKFTNDYKLENIYQDYYMKAEEIKFKILKTFNISDINEVLIEYDKEPRG